MLHRALLTTTVATLLIAVFVADLARYPILAGAAQEAATPDIGADFPAGIEAVTLATGAVDALPEPPAQFRLDRVTMEPGDEHALQPAPGPESHFVKSAPA
jgi:hypothetical protein